MYEITSQGCLIVISMNLQPLVTIVGGYRNSILKARHFNVEGTHQQFLIPKERGEKTLGMTKYNKNKKLELPFLGW